MRIYVLVTADGKDLCVFASKATMEKDACGMWPNATWHSAGPSYFSELVKDGVVVARGFCRALVTD